MADLAGIREGQQLVDIGCGMGASSIHLAKTRSCECLGVTISPLQRKWASISARWHGVAGRTEFRCADAEQSKFVQASRDIVWSVECTEHLFDKPRFFERAAGWLKPGGTMAICAWLVGDTSDAGRANKVYDVCEGFFALRSGRLTTTLSGWQCRPTGGAAVRLDNPRQPNLGDLQRAGAALANALVGPGVWPDSVLFLDRFDSILGAYQSGAMKYGCFIARKSPLA